MTEKIGKIIAYGGGVIFIGIIVTFLLPFSEFSFSEEINHNKLSQLGATLSGIVAPLWTFAGIIYFVVALRDQRNDFDTNRVALKAQIDEFQLQRVELHETRKIYKEQSETIKQQQFEFTFFNTLELFIKTTEKLRNHPPLSSDIDIQINLFDYLISIFRTNFESEKTKYIEEMKSNHSELKSSLSNGYILSDEYLMLSICAANKKIHIKGGDLLNQYFKLFEIIINLIDSNNLGINSNYYIKLLQANISLNEHLILYYTINFKANKETKNTLKELLEKYDYFSFIKKEQLVSPTVIVTNML